MFKWVGFILSFIFGRLNAQTPLAFQIKESALEAFDEMTLKSRKTVRLILVAAASVLFICGGFFIALIDATQQYDQNGIIFISSAFVSGILLTLFSSAVFIWVFTSAWPGIAKSRLKTSEDTLSRNLPPHQPSNIELAISALIMDFVHEREENRAKNASEDIESPHSDSETPPLYSH